MNRRWTAMAISAIGLVVTTGLALAGGQYGPGVSDTEIKIGNTVPYSGPASAYGTIGKSEAAYFAMINDQGGINGRKVNFLSRDDSYSPPKTLEVVRRLVEEDQVLLMFGTLGTPPNTAIQGYLNDNKVPQLFVPSRPGEFHPEPLTESGRDTLVSSGSCHRVKAAAFRREFELLPLPVGSLPTSVTCPLRSTSITPASSLVRGSPPLSGASVLSASRVLRLCFLPWHRRPGSQVPYESPIESHASYTPDTAWPVGRSPPYSS
jgi:Periplasmic binding protein